MTFDEVILALPKDTTLTEFKGIEQLVSRQSLQAVARICKQNIYDTLYDLFVDFLIIGYYTTSLNLRQINSTLNNINVDRNNRRLYELGLL